MTRKTDGQPAGASPPRRRRLRRLAAVLFGLLTVVAAEGVCRLAGWGDPRLREDPFVGFAGQRPLFVLSPDRDTYKIPHVRENYFARDSFPARKGPEERRVFCLGGSTVQGRPYSIQTSFTTWLELALETVDKVHNWEVVNCGGISYASYRLVPILEECLQYDPDLIILCTGHNEFLEDRSYPDVSRSPLFHQTSRLRLVNLARDVADRFRGGGEDENVGPGKTILPLETEPILNFNAGLSVYHRDETWRRGVIDHFEANVRRMLNLSQASGVPILLMQPASNLRDCPPFKSEHRSELTDEERRRWDALSEQAQTATIADPLRAVEIYEQATAVDDQFALGHYRLGRAYLAIGDTATARTALVRARDLDVCPLRILSEMEGRLAGIAADFDVPFLDLHALLESEAKDGILGESQLIDHIHPSIEGHQRIAEALVEFLATHGFVTLPDDWRPPAQAAFKRHLDSLDSAYFLRGQRMLHGLQEWSKGRADGPPASERFPDRDPVNR